jgi:hypothetical protein
MMPFGFKVLQTKRKKICANRRKNSALSGTINFSKSRFDYLLGDFPTGIELALGYHVRHGAKKSDDYL